MSWSGLPGAQGPEGLPNSNHIAKSIERALRGESYLDPEILKIPGFATPTMRHLFSNLCHIDGAKYLEVGVFCGATFFAAFNNNPITAHGVENFAQPFEQENVPKQLKANWERWGDFGKPGRGLCDLNFEDVFKIDWRPDIVKTRFDIYFYDGEHSFESQSRALPTLFDMLARHFIFIVDDYSWAPVASGTEEGFEQLKGKLKIEQEWTLFGEQTSDDKIWHNGVAIFLCSKIK